MLDKVLFPIRIGDKDVSATFFTDKMNKMEDKVSFIKYSFPYILCSVDKKLRCLEMSPLIYNFSYEGKTIISSFSTSIHVFKLKVTEKDIYISIHDIKSEKVLKRDKLVDNIDHCDFNDISKLYSSLVEESVHNIMEIMFDILEKLIERKYLEK